MSTTLTFTGTLKITTCGVCQISHAIPQDMYDDRLKHGGNWYCPNGHRLQFVTTESQKLEERLASEKQRRDWAEARVTSLRDQLGASERSRRAQKGVTTRIKNRIAAGVCPCCNRSFQDLRRHMNGQHPDFAPTEEQA